MTSITQILLQLKAAIFIVLGGIVTIFFIRRDQKNEIKNRTLQDTIDEARRTKKSKNNFNNLSDSEQSEWMFNDLKEKRDKFSK